MATRVRHKKEHSFYKASEEDYKNMDTVSLRHSDAYKHILGSGKGSMKKDQLIETLSHPLALCHHASKKGLRGTIEYDNLPKSEKAKVAETETGSAARMNACKLMLVGHSMKPTTKSRNAWARSPAKASKRALVHAGIGKSTKVAAKKTKKESKEKKTPKKVKKASATKRGAESMTY
jgi:hypothetical protein